ncbi:MAG: hypothetical protein WKG07_05525 [Hymenobacter sp.]
MQFLLAGGAEGVVGLQVLFIRRILGGLVEGGGRIGEARAAQVAEVALAVVGHGLQGDVALLGGVGKDVAGHLGRHHREVLAGLLLVAGLAGHAGGGAALGLLAQGLHVGNDFGQARHYGLQGLVGGVGGRVLPQGGEQGFGGGEAVILVSG